MTIQGRYEKIKVFCCELARTLFCRRILILSASSVDTKLSTSEWQGARMIMDLKILWSEIPAHSVSEPEVASTTDERITMGVGVGYYLNASC